MNEGVNLTETERAIIEEVIIRFLNEHKPSDRHSLILKFEDPDALSDLANRGFLKGEPTNQNFLPTLLAFCCCGNESVFSEARESTISVIKAMRSLFSKVEPNAMVTASDIETEIQSLGASLTHNTLWLGLYLAESFSVFGGWQPAVDQIGKDSVRIGERVVKMKNPEQLWNERVYQEFQWLRQRDSYTATARTIQLMGAFHEDSDAEISFTQAISKHFESSEANPMKQGLQIFISHSSKDHDIALSFIELLRASLILKDQDIRCTSVTGFRLPAGANTDEVLKAEVLEAKAFIGLITPNSISSPYVLFELGGRWVTKKYMIPLLLGLSPDALQGPLKGINAVSADQIGQLHQLLDDLADELEIPLQRPAVYSRYAEKLAQHIQQFYQTPVNNHKVFSPTTNTAGFNDQHASSGLSRAAIIVAAQSLEWDKELPKWTVTVEGRRLPIRPLARAALDLPPHARVSTRKTVEKLKKLGFQVLYEGKPV